MIERKEQGVLYKSGRQAEYTQRLFPLADGARGGGRMIVRMRPESALLKPDR